MLTNLIKNSNNKKLLRINLNIRLGFDTHVANICNQVSKKLHTLARTSPAVLWVVSVCERKPW